MSRGPRFAQDEPTGSLRNVIAEARQIEIIRGLGLGGAETLLVQRLRLAVESGQLPAQRTVVVSTAPSQDHYVRELLDLGIHVVTTSTDDPLRGGYELVRLLGAARPATALVVHSPAPALAIHAGRALGRIAPPAVQVLHSSKFKLPWLLGGRLLNRHAAAAVAVSSAVASAPTSRGFREVRTIYGGIDPRPLRQAERGPGSRIRELRDRATAGGGTGTLLLVAVGRLIPLKGHDRLLRGFAATPPEVDVRLVIIGEGTERERLEALAIELGVTARVTFVGRHVPGWEWIAAADVLCHTSTYEGLPVVLMEAATLGVPIIATPFEGATEIATLDPGLVTIVDHDDAAGLAAAITAHARNARPQLPSDRWTTHRYLADMTDLTRRVTGRRA